MSADHELGTSADLIQRPDRRSSVIDDVADHVLMKIGRKVGRIARVAYNTFLGIDDHGLMSLCMTGCREADDAVRELIFAVNQHDLIRIGRLDIEKVRIVAVLKIRCRMTIP